MKQKLEELIQDKDLVDKIVKAYIQYGTMSEGYLAHKFRFNSYICKHIMKIVKDWEKEPV